MQKIKITQIQFQAKSTPSDNAILLESYFQKTRTFKPDLICTPECSNIITNDKKYLFDNSTYQKNCPILNMKFEDAELSKMYINAYLVNDVILTNLLSSISKLKCELLLQQI